MFWFTIFFLFIFLIFDFRFQLLFFFQDFSTEVGFWSWSLSGISAKSLIRVVWTLLTPLILLNPMSYCGFDTAYEFMFVNSENSFSIERTFCYKIYIYYLCSSVACFGFTIFFIFFIFYFRFQLLFFFILGSFFSTPLIQGSLLVSFSFLLC